MDINTKEYISENEILMQEWDYEANVELNPENLKRGSNKKLGGNVENVAGNGKLLFVVELVKNLQVVRIVRGKKF